MTFRNLTIWENVGIQETQHRSLMLSNVIFSLDWWEYPPLKIQRKSRALNRQRLILFLLLTVTWKKNYCELKERFCNDSFPIFHNSETLCLISTMNLGNRKKGLERRGIEEVTSEVPKVDIGLDHQIPILFNRFKVSNHFSLQWGYFKDPLYIFTLDPSLLIVSLFITN